MEHNDQLIKLMTDVARLEERLSLYIDRLKYVEVQMPSEDKINAMVKAADANEKTLAQLSEIVGSINKLKYKIAAGITIVTTFVTWFIVPVIKELLGRFI